MASVSDLSRPVEKLSVYQNGSLAATGLIWSRYSLVIKPKNWGLFSCNFFVFVCNAAQLARIYAHHSELEQSESIEKDEQ